MPSRILFVFTSANKNLKGGQTVTAHSITSNAYLRFFQGWYLPEAAHPYYVLSKTHQIDFASPKGPNPPVDEGSVKVCNDFIRIHLMLTHLSVSDVHRR